MPLDARTMGAIAGVVLGVTGSVVGTAASLSRAESAAERRCIVKWALAVSGLIGSFVGSLWLVPKAHHVWVHGTYVIAITVMMRVAMADCARLQRTQTLEGRAVVDDGIGPREGLR